MLICQNDKKKKSFYILAVIALKFNSLGNQSAGLSLKLEH
jgi:hypothetical protein